MSFPNRQAYAKKADMGKFITLDKLASKFMEVKNVTFLLAEIPPQVNVSCLERP